MPGRSRSRRKSGRTGKIRRTSRRSLRTRKRKRSISKKLKGGYLESKINQLEDVAEIADTDNDGILNPAEFDDVQVAANELFPELISKLKVLLEKNLPPKKVDDMNQVIDNLVSKQNYQNGGTGLALADGLISATVTDVASGLIAVAALSGTRFNFVGPALWKGLDGVAPKYVVNAIKRTLDSFKLTTDDFEPVKIDLTIPEPAPDAPAPDAPAPDAPAPDAPAPAPAPDAPAPDAPAPAPDAPAPAPDAPAPAPDAPAPDAPAPDAPEDKWDDAEWQEKSDIFEADRTTPAPLSDTEVALNAAGAVGILAMKTGATIFYAQKAEDAINYLNNTPKNKMVEDLKAISSKLQKTVPNPSEILAFCKIFGGHIFKDLTIVNYIRMVFPEILNFFMLNGIKDISIENNKFNSDFTSKLNAYLEVISKDNDFGSNSDNEKNKPEDIGNLSIHKLIGNRLKNLRDIFISSGKDMDIPLEMLKEFQEQNKKQIEMYDRIENHSTKFLVYLDKSMNVLEGELKKKLPPEVEITKTSIIDYDAAKMLFKDILLLFLYLNEIDIIVTYIEYNEKNPDSANTNKRDLMMHAVDEFKEVNEKYKVYNSKFNMNIVNNITNGDNFFKMTDDEKFDIINNIFMFQLLLFTNSMTSPEYFFDNKADEHSKNIDNLILGNYLVDNEYLTTCLQYAESSEYTKTLAIDIKGILVGSDDQEIHSGKKGGTLRGLGTNSSDARQGGMQGPDAAAAAAATATNGPDAPIVKPPDPESDPTEMEKKFLEGRNVPVNYIQGPNGKQSEKEQKAKAGIDTNNATMNEAWLRAGAEADQGKIPFMGLVIPKGTADERQAIELKDPENLGDYTANKKQQQLFTFEELKAYILQKIREPKVIEEINGARSKGELRKIWNRSGKGTLNEKKYEKTKEYDSGTYYKMCKDIDEKRKYWMGNDDGAPNHKKHVDSLRMQISTDILWLYYINKTSQTYGDTNPESRSSEAFVAEDIPGAHRIDFAWDKSFFSAMRDYEGIKVLNSSTILEAGNAINWTKYFKRCVLVFGILCMAFMIWWFVTGYLGIGNSLPIHHDQIIAEDTQDKFIRQSEVDSKHFTTGLRDKDLVEQKLNFAPQGENINICKKTGEIHELPLLDRIFKRTADIERDNGIDVDDRIDSKWIIFNKGVDELDTPTSPFRTVIGVSPDAPAILRDLVNDNLNIAKGPDGEAVTGVHTTGNLLGDGGDKNIHVLVHGEEGQGESVENAQKECVLDATVPGNEFDKCITDYKPQGWFTKTSLDDRKICIKRDQSGLPFREKFFLEGEQEGTKAGTEIIGTNGVDDILGYRRGSNSVTLKCGDMTKVIERPNDQQIAVALVDTTGEDSKSETNIFKNIGLRSRARGSSLQIVKDKNGLLKGHQNPKSKNICLTEINKASWWNSWNRDHTTFYTQIFNFVHTQAMTGLGFLFAFGVIVVGFGAMEYIHRYFRQNRLKKALGDESLKHRDLVNEVYKGFYHNIGKVLRREIHDMFGTTHLDAQRVPRLGVSREDFVTMFSDDSYTSASEQWIIKKIKDKGYKSSRSPTTKWNFFNKIANKPFETLFLNTASKDQSENNPWGISIDQEALDDEVTPLAKAWNTIILSKNKETGKFFLVQKPIWLLMIMYDYINILTRLHEVYLNSVTNMMRSQIKADAAWCEQFKEQLGLMAYSAVKRTGQALESLGGVASAGLGTAMDLTKKMAVLGGSAVGNVAGFATSRLTWPASMLLSGGGKRKSNRKTLRKSKRKSNKPRRTIKKNKKQKITRRTLKKNKKQKKKRRSIKKR
jgi:hypothetical protein